MEWERWACDFQSPRTSPRLYAPSSVSRLPERLKIMQVFEKHASHNALHDTRDFRLRASSASGCADTQMKEGMNRNRRANNIQGHASCHCTLGRLALCPGICRCTVGNETKRGTWITLLSQQHSNSMRCHTQTLHPALNHSVLKRHTRIMLFIF